MRPNIRPIYTGGPSGANSIHDNPATTGQKVLSLEKNSVRFFNMTFFLLFYQNDVKFLKHYSVKFCAYFSFNAFICKEYRTKSFFLIRPLFGPTVFEIIRLKFGRGVPRPFTSFSAPYGSCSRIFCQLATGQGEGRRGWCWRIHLHRA